MINELLTNDNIDVEALLNLTFDRILTLTRRFYNYIVDGAEKRDAPPGIAVVMDNIYDTNVCGNMKS